MNKKELNERDICTKFITPALGQDYILYYRPNIPLAVIEAKDNHCSVGDGMQALEYGRRYRFRSSFRPTSRTFITSASTVCSYSLKQGIHDGFVAPYKVVKVHIDRDIEGYRFVTHNM